MAIRIPGRAGDQRPTTKLSSRLLDMKFMQRGPNAASPEPESPVVKTIPDGSAARGNSSTTPEGSIDIENITESWRVPGIETQRPRYTAQQSLGFTELEGETTLFRRKWHNGVAQNVLEEEKDSSDHDDGNTSVDSVGMKRKRDSLSSSGPKSNSKSKSKGNGKSKSSTKSGQKKARISH